MNTAIISAGALTPYADVARAAELEPWALRRLEQARFRVEANFRDIEGQEYLTVDGIRAMARTLEQHGYPLRAHSLRVLAKRQEETPSVNLINKQPWYRRGSQA